MNVGAAAGMLRELTVILLAFGMMLGLQALRWDGGGGGSDPLTLGAIGFVILAAYTFGDVVRRLGLPRVTGYIVVGATLGPSVVTILSHANVKDMQSFNTLALGLIALSAGLELQMATIRQVLRTILTTTALKLLLLILLVGGCVVLILSNWPILSFPSTAHIWSLALLLAVLGLGTSPAIALAVSKDANASGRMTSLVLGSAIVKDLAVVVSLAVAVALAGAWLSTGSEAGGGPQDLVMALGGELGGSFLAGAALGGALILYMRFIKVELLAATVIAVLLMAEVAQLLHLELLLVFISAGFVVSNFSPYEHELLGPLHRVSLPVFVVFFTNAGAGIDLAGTVRILPLALAIAVTRGFVFFVAGTVGARLAGEQPKIVKNAWLGYLPQAGVTLGLVMLAANTVPQLHDAIMSVGVAMVAINLLVGPITLGVALRRAGDIPSAGGGAAEGLLFDADTPLPGPAPAGSGDAPPVVTLPDAGLEPVLAAELATLHADLCALVDAAVDGAFTIGLADRDESLRPLLHLEHTDDGLRNLEFALGDLAQAQTGAFARDVVDFHAQLVALFEQSAERVRQVSREVVVPLVPALLQPPPGAEWGHRLRAVVERLRRGLGMKPRPRTVVLRMLVRVALEPRLAQALRDALGLWARAYAASLELLASRVDGTRSEAQAEDALETASDETLRRLRADLRRAVTVALSECQVRAAIAGGPALPLSAVRYSTVEPRIAEALQGARDDAHGWSVATVAAGQTVAANARIVRLQYAVRDTLEKHAMHPARALFQVAVPAVDLVASTLAALASEVEAVPPNAWALPERTAERLKAALPNSVRRAVKRAAHALREDTQVNRALEYLESHECGGELELKLVSPKSAVSGLASPSALISRDVALGRWVDRTIQEQLLPGLEQLLMPFWDLSSSLADRLQQGISVATFGVDLAARGEFDDESARREMALDALHRAERVASELRDELMVATEALEAGLGALRADLSRHLTVTIDGSRTKSRMRLLLVWSAVQSWLRRERDRVVRLGRGAVQGVSSYLTRLAERRDVRDRRIRSGHERLDARRMREYLAVNVPTPREIALPAVYTQLFSPAPITDPRVFTARRSLLRSLVSELRQSDWKTPVAILVSGPAGMGRTSLVNMVQVQLGRLRVVRPAATFGAGVGLLQKLSSELDCGPGVASIVHELARVPTVVLLDDLSHWFDPAECSERDSHDLAELVQTAGAGVRWLATISDDAAAGLADPEILRGTFHRHDRLGPLDVAALGALIERRVKLAAMRLHYGPRNAFARLPWARTGVEELYLRALRRTSQGNPRDALTLHLWSTQTLGDDRLLVAQPPPLALPFLGQLDSVCLAVLSLLLRHGPMTSEQLARVLLSRKVAAEAARRLELSGLAVRSPNRGQLELPVHLAGPITAGLRAEHILPEDPRW